MISQADAVNIASHVVLPHPLDSTGVDIPLRLLCLLLNNEENVNVICQKNCFDAFQLRLHIDAADRIICLAKLALDASTKRTDTIRYLITASKALFVLDMMYYIANVLAQSEDNLSIGNPADFVDDLDVGIFQATVNLMNYCREPHDAGAPHAHACTVRFSAPRSSRCLHRSSHIV